VESRYLQNLVAGKLVCFKVSYTPPSHKPSTRKPWPWNGSWLPLCRCWVLLSANHQHFCTEVCAWSCWQCWRPQRSRQVASKSTFRVPTRRLAWCSMEYRSAGWKSVPRCCSVVCAASINRDWIYSLSGTDTILDGEDKGLSMFFGCSMALMVESDRLPVAAAFEVTFVENSRYRTMMKLTDLNLRFVQSRRLTAKSRLLIAMRMTWLGRPLYHQ
jgi:hypothetical protein